MAIMTPQHLNRLRLLPDEYLFTDKSKKLTSSVKFCAHPQSSKCQQSLPDSITKARKLLDKIKNITIFGKPISNVTDSADTFQQYQAYKTKVDASINSFDISLLLQMALMKIPQIPFGYILDRFQWDLFSEKIPFAFTNEYFWQLAIKEQGIHPPGWLNRRNFFDPGAKFHVADNTPFVR